MKRFITFASAQYYPSGGIGDMIGFFETLEEAEQAGKDARRDWWEVLDVQLEKEVSSGDCDAMPIKRRDGEPAEHLGDAIYGIAPASTPLAGFLAGQEKRGGISGIDTAANNYWVNKGKSDVHD